MTFFNDAEEMKDAIYGESNVMEFLSIYDDYERLLVDVDDYCPHLADAFRSLISATEYNTAVMQWVEDGDRG